MWPNGKCLVQPRPLLHLHLPHCSSLWSEIGFPYNYLGSHMASDIFVCHEGPSIAAWGALARRPFPAWVMQPPHILSHLAPAFPLQPQRAPFSRVPCLRAFALSIPSACEALPLPLCLIIFLIPSLPSVHTSRTPSHPRAFAQAIYAA